MRKNKWKRQSNNAGFTLVEMIVVLVIMVILLSLSAVGILTWQDWSRMKKLNANAETIFMAVQDQLAAYSSSGSLEREVQEPIQNADGSFSVREITQTGSDGTIAVGLLTNSEGEHYDWDSLWSTAVGKTDAEKYRGRIVSLSSSPMDYEKYLKGEEIDAGTKLLFKLVTSYVYDKTILNNASILLELSPDAGQVFSVCYSDEADRLAYSEAEGVCANDRSEAVRNELFIGYYGVDTLSKAIKGKTSSMLNIPAGAFELRNEEILDALYSPLDPEDVFGSGKDLTFILNLYNPDIAVNDRSMKKIMSLEFDFKSSEGLPIGMRAAQGSGATEMRATYYKDGNPVDLGEEEIVFRVPVWIDLSSGGSRVIRIALDAADVQAQSVTYATALGMDGDDTISDATRQKAEEAFSKTYSFYRFGLDTDRIFLGLKIRDNTETKETDEVISSRQGSMTENLEGEYTAFASVSRSDGEARYGIANGRHLYNLRFAEDYAEAVEPDTTGDLSGTLRNNTDWHTSYKRSYTLLSDIDWHKFCAYQYLGSNVGYNYFFNSYDSGVSANGNNEIIYSGIGLAGIETESVEFPAFRCIAFGDSLAGTKSETENYSISNLTITTDANERFGVYGYAAQQMNLDHLKTMDGSRFDALELERAKGKHPTGLFAYNKGSIKDLTLAEHKVFGAYKVGGFAGESLGTLSGLTLQNEENSGATMDNVETALVKKIVALKLIVPYFNGDNTQDGVSYYKLRYNFWTNDDDALQAYLSAELYGKNSSFVVGIHDVGGICGYQKYIAGDDTVSNEAVYENLRNEAWVCGQEYVGGVIGRSIVRYSDSALTDRYEAAMEDDPSAVVRRIKLGAATFRNVNNTGRIEALPVYDINGYVYFNGNITRSGEVNLRRANYLGGICGMACDNSTSMAYTQEAAAIRFYDCHSCWLYTQAEIDSLISGTAGDMDALLSQMRGSYYGGLVGFARLVSFTDCDTIVEGQDQESKAGFIFGKNYVGGICGVTQLCGFSNTTEGDMTTNTLHVTGRSMVGGISGLIGTPKTFDLNNDAENRLKAYQYNPWNLSLQRPESGSNSRYTELEYLGNTGLTFAASGGSTESWRPEANAWVGGICGWNSEELNNCDSILTAYAKEEMLKLITMVGGNESYCGNDAGGLVGHNSWRINYKTASHSRINTIVYGRSYVGGATGYTSIDENNQNSRFNSVLNCVLVDGVAVDLPSENCSGFGGSYIRALKDYAGGICGLVEYGAILNTSDYPVNGDFIVHADNYAGGFIGFAKGKINGAPCQYAGIVAAKSGGMQKVAADGFYAGGFAGAVARHAIHDSNPENRISCVSGVSEVKAGYFAGGFAGAAIVPQMSNVGSAFAISDRYCSVANAQMSVTADVAAGGYYGYYEVCTTSWDEGAATLYANLSAYAGNAAQFAQALEALPAGTMQVSGISYDQNNIGSKRGVVNNLILSPDEGAVLVGSVTATYDAGGLFGFVPDAQSIQISYQGGNNVTTTGSPLDGGYTYAGGIIGRTGSNMVLSNCSNKGIISSQADYYGPLCECNRGIIENCTVAYAVPAGSNSYGYTGEYLYVGGLCGRNEGVIRGYINSGKANGEYSGFDVIGAHYAGGLCGENAGTISLSTDYRYPVSVAGEEYAGGVCGRNQAELKYGDKPVKSNSAEALVSGKFAGLIAGKNDSVIDGVTVDSSAAIWAANTAGEAGAASAFTGCNAGTIKNCVNLTAVYTEKGSAAAFCGLAESGSVYDNLVNRADIYSEGVAAGIVALAIDGGSVTINNCRNYGKVTSGTGGYGICAAAAKISNCLEAGGIVAAEHVYDASAQADNNYYIAGSISQKEHDVTKPLTLEEENKSYTIKADGEHIFKLWYKKTDELSGTISENVVAEKVSVSFSKGDSVSLTLSSIYEKMGLSMESLPVVEGAEYYLTITAPAAEYESGASLVALVSFARDGVYDLYALFDGIPYHTSVTGLSADPANFGLSSRVDEVDAAFESKLIK